MLNYFNSLGKCYDKVIDEKLNKIERIYLTEEILLELLKDKKRSLKGHRGSYKTTALIEIGCLVMLLFNPNIRICLIQKDFTKASRYLKTISDMMKVPEVRALFELIHNNTPKPIKDADNIIIFNFKKTITKEGNINAFGVKQNMIGWHFDLIIADDFITIDDKTSKAEREATRLHIEEISNNILDPGKQMIYSGTIWHREDAWTICPDAIVFDWNITNILTKEEKLEKTTGKTKLTRVTLAANYELKHVIAEDQMFKEACWDRWSYKYKKKVYGHLDAKYKGDHTNALTFMVKKEDGRFQGIGFCFHEHVDDKFDFIVAKYNKYFCCELICEENADKGYLAKDLRAKGINVTTYNEKMNKTVKIEKFGYPNWEFIDWDYDTDPEYISQIQDYTEKEEPDDCCFVAGTKVLTTFGNKNIENLKVGDKVYTPFGFKKIIKTFNREKEIISNIGLTGTPDHKIYNKEKNLFVSLDSLTSLLHCDKITLKGAIKWQIKKLLYLMDKHIQRQENIIFVNNQIQKEKFIHNCIEQFGNFIITKKYLKGVLFIIKILIQIIMTYLIWNYLQIMNIKNTILKKEWKIQNLLNRIKNIWKKLEKKQKNGIKVKKVKNGINNTQKNLLKRFGILEKKEYANNVEMNILQKYPDKNIVLENVEIETEVKHLENINYVLCVDQKFSSKKELDKIQNIVPGNVIIKQITNKKRKEKVYNIMVEDIGVYYANNILVSNCDSMSSLLKYRFYEDFFNMAHWKP